MVDLKALRRLVTESKAGRLRHRRERARHLRQRGGAARSRRPQKTKVVTADDFPTPEPGRRGGFPRQLQGALRPRRLRSRWGLRVLDLTRRGRGGGSRRAGWRRSGSPSSCFFVGLVLVPSFLVVVVGPRRCLSASEASRPMFSGGTPRRMRPVPRCRRGGAPSAPLRRARTGRTSEIGAQIVQRRVLVASIAQARACSRASSVVGAAARRRESEQARNFRSLTRKPPKSSPLRLDDVALARLIEANTRWTKSGRASARRGRPVVGRQLVGRAAAGHRVEPEGDDRVGGGEARSGASSPPATTPRPSTPRRAQTATELLAPASRWRSQTTPMFIPASRSDPRRGMAGTGFGGGRGRFSAASLANTSFGSGSAASTSGAAPSSTLASTAAPPGMRPPRAPRRPPRS